MHKALAREQEKKLRNLLGELHAAQSVSARQGIAVRMGNLTPPLYIVSSEAGQHIEEALKKLKYQDRAVVNASLATIADALGTIRRVIDEHPHEHFAQLSSRPRLFAKPVSADELRSVVEKGRVLHESHGPFVFAIDAPAHVENVLLTADSQTLRPVLQRMGFPSTDALVFFTARHHPLLVKPAENLASINLAKLRSGSPTQVVRHRVLV